MANDIGTAIGNLFKKAGDEWNRATKELEENFAADIDSIGVATEKGGFLGGIVQAADVFSAGNIVAETLDGFNVIPEEPALKEGISAGVNLGVGLALAGATGVPVFAVGGALLAAKDTAAAPSASAVSFAAEAPQAGERAGQGVIVTTTRPNAGYAGPTFADHIGGNMDKVLERIRDMFGKDKAGASDDELERAIDKILASGMCFEDMIFALLKTIIRDTEKQGKAMFKELKGSRQESAKTRDAMTADVKAKREELKGETDPQKRAALQGELDDLVSERATFMDDTASSRAEIAEDLKNLMQKLSEMQQALSNILNAQHESAMAAIRNIR